MFHELLVFLVLYEGDRGRGRGRGRVYMSNVETFIRLGYGEAATTILTKITRYLCKFVFLYNSRNETSAEIYFTY